MGCNGIQLAAYIQAEHLGHPNLMCEIDMLIQYCPPISVVCLHCTREELQRDWVHECWNDLTTGFPRNRLMMLVFP